MALTNAFVAGPCTVHLVFSDYDHSVVLGLGESSGPFPGFNFDGSGETVQFDVDGDGILTLSLVAGSLQNGYEIHVVPSAVFSGGSISDISLPNLQPNPFVFSDQGDDVHLTYVGEEGDVTPDPATIPAGNEYVAMFMGAFS